MSKVKVSVLYPASEGATFDMDYYMSKHLPLCKEVLGPESYSAEKGIPGQPYIAIGHLIFESMEAMQQGMSGPRAVEAQADIPNYTNVTPQIQISEIVE